MTVELGAVVDIKDVVNAAGLIGPVDDAVGATTALGTSPTRRDSQAARHGQAPKPKPQPATQATASGGRKIQARRDDLTSYAYERSKSGVAAPSTGRVFALA